MAYLMGGLLIFLAAHSVQIVAEDWRTRTRARIGEQAFKGIYSVLSLIGLVLIVWGFGVARETPFLLWLPPTAMRHVAALFNVLAFVLLAAAHVPGNAIQARVRHPMVLGVAIWAFAHLVSNGNLAHVVLFGSFLVWAVLDYTSACRRDRARGIQYRAGTVGATVLTVLLGGAVAGVFTLWLHGLLIGIKPFG